MNHLLGGHPCSDDIDSVLEVAVGGQYNSKKVLDERGVVVLVLHPFLGAFSEGVIIIGFGHLYLLLERDVLPYLISALVEKKRGEEPRHPAVPVVEGMDAEEVVDEDWNDDEGVYAVLVVRLIVFLTELFDGFRGLKRLYRPEEDDLRPVLRYGVDLVWRILELSAESLVGESV